MKQEVKRIVIAGSSGFLGRRLVSALRAANYEVLSLRRGEGQEASWDPNKGCLDEQYLAGAHAVLCLNGASIAGRPWTRSYMDTLRSSRVDSVTTVVAAMGRLPLEDRPKSFLCASAVGFYGAECGDETVDEQSLQGTGFLADLCADWEAAAAQAAELGARTVHLRTGLVLGAEGGMLKALLTPYRLGVGARLGSGQTWMPVISVEDWTRAVIFILEQSAISGPVNLVCPSAVQGKEFHALLASALRRPALFAIPQWLLCRVPGFPLRAFVHEVVLSSQRAVPSILLGAGFEFRSVDCEQILRSVLERS